MNPKVKMIDRLIRDQVKLVPDFPHNDNGLREVITQVVTGKPGQRITKLYQCLVESFIMVGGSDQSNQGYYDRQKVKPSYHRIKQAVKQAACPKLASFDMVFSHIFFTQAPGWDYQAIGVRMVAIDTLVHNFLAKTGTLDYYDKPHKYGPKCHSQAGCVGVIEEIARDLNCRKYHPSYPAYFPLKAS